MSAPANPVVFVDTNVLVYALDPSEADKCRAARRWLDVLWRAGAGRISWQVLNELYSVAVRRFADVAPVRAVIRDYTLWQPAGFSRSLIEHAWQLSDGAALSWWDALIVAAASRSGARWLLTEDLQTGRTFEDVTAISPFVTAPEDIGFPSFPEPPIAV